MDFNYLNSTLKFDLLVSITNELTLP